MESMDIYLLVGIRLRRRETGPEKGLPMSIPQSWRPLLRRLWEVRTADERHTTPKHPVGDALDDEILQTRSNTVVEWPWIPVKEMKQRTTLSLTARASYT
jgi:hypothetical protein